MSEPKPTDYYQGQSVSDFIALFALPWHLANVVKYIVRWWLKDDMAGLYKAKDYLDTFIANCEADRTFKASTVAGIKATIEARRAAKVKPEEDSDILSSPVPGFDVDGNMVCVIRCTKCGDQLQARTQPGWRIGISDKWEHQCGEGGEWYTANDFWPIGISAKATKPPTEDEIMGAEFDALKPGDVIENGGGDRWVVTEIPNGSSVRKGTIRMRHVTWGKETASHEFWRDMYVRNHWRKVPDAKPVDAAPAEPESDFDTLEVGDMICGKGGPREVTSVDHEAGRITYAYFGANCPLSRKDFIRFYWCKVAKS